MSHSFIFGLIAGVAAGTIILLLCRKKAAAPKYDERQTAARDRACKHGFFGMLIMCALFIFADILNIADIPVASAMEAVLFLGAGVCAISAILNDAFIGYNEAFRKWLVIGICITVGNLCSGFSQLSYSPSTAVISLGVGTLWGMIVIIQLLHRARSTAGGSEDE